MNYYSYVLDHDYGLAPNPFGTYCTLTVCKPAIRRSGNLKIGDWIIGTGSKALEVTSGRKCIGHIIYAMQVSEIITMNDYWNDPRFQYKKPIMNASLVYMFGDNFYHKDKNDNWVQEDSAHSNNNGSLNQNHLDTDTGGANALVALDFFYFGRNAPLIPEMYASICHRGIGHKKIKSQGDAFINWLKTNFQQGIHGDPISWIQFDQQKLFI